MLKKLVIISLHDLNLMFQLPHYIIALKNNQSTVIGYSKEVLTTHLLYSIFGLDEQALTTLNRRGIST